MAIKYRNQRTGRTVTVSEPKEREAELRKVRHRGRPLKPEKIKVEAKRRQRTIEKLDNSWRWQRAGNGAAKTAKAAKEATKGEGE